MTNERTCNGEVVTTAGTKRGALIVMEGCDRTGKTTQAKKLVENMNAKGQKAVFMRFPDRTTQIGGLIDGYLSQGVDLEDHVIHLLFSANRWEFLPKMKSTLESGTSIIIDRYAFSGVAFSGAKKGLGLEWCKGSDAGLPKPDAVLFLDLPPEAAAARGQYGNERYEKLEFQDRVYQNYMALKDATWKMIDASKSVEEVESSITAAVDEIVEREKSGTLPVLWN
ncbi:thymidylate kinase-like isoform X2 [Eriocheir sinensis]|nr:thymidylate kinase-like isoform X2 [Eriocheir sinensis]